MNAKKIIEVLEMIAQDQVNDARNFEGAPFTGRTVAEYFGNQGAAIVALADIIKSLVESAQEDIQYCDCQPVPRTTTDGRCAVCELPRH